MALLGIHHAHSSLFTGIQLSQSKRPLTEDGERVKADMEKAMIDAVKTGDAEFFRIVADLLEIAKEGPRSPNEHALITKRRMVFQSTIQNDVLVKFKRAPTTISTLRSVVEKETGNRPSATWTKAAAKRLGIEIRRGRPEGNKEVAQKIKRRIKGK